MENLSLIAAFGKNKELGLENRLIWKLKEDLKFYRNITMQERNIIMGRKTFESMPSVAFNGRNPFVLSSRPLDMHYDVNSFNNIESLLKYIEVSDERFIVIGGAQIYKEFLPYVDTMYLTKIDDYAEADTFFPDFEVSDWDIELIYNNFNEVSSNETVYIRNKYVRKRVK